jgi:phenylacetate-CoA ligase
MPLNEQLKEIIAYGYANAPALRKLMDKAGLTPADVQSLADLPKIPVTTKDQLAQMQQQDPPFGGWLAVPVEKVRHIFVSPGPIFEAEGETEERDLGVFKAVGIGPGDIVLNTFAYHLVSAGLLLDTAGRAGGATIVPAGPGNTEYQIEIMMRLKTTGYTGTPSFLKIILDKAAEMGIPRQKIPLKKAIFSAEPYPPLLRAFFEQEYGLITASAFATAELGVIAYDWSGATSALKLARNVIVEIVDPETGQPVPAGEPGEMVVTRFSKTYPLVRLGLGDLSTYVGEPDEDGYYTHIKGWLGRVGDAVKVRGMFLHPLQLKGAIAKFDALGAVQAIVTRPQTRDQVELRIELKDDSLEKDALAEEVKNVVSQACRLRIDRVEFVQVGTIAPSARVVVDERSWE